MAIMPVVCVEYTCNEISDGTIDITTIFKPNYSTATVDGDCGEWDTTDGSTDFFWEMHKGGSHLW